MIEERVLQVLKEQCGIHENDHLLLGFSGGSDSVSLLHVLASLKFNVTVAYFNHNLRESVEEEERFAHEAAKRYGLNCFIGSENIKKISTKSGKGLEETARAYRYRFLAETAAKVGAKAIVVAHHADDQVETILMNLVRGTGLDGLVGMQHVAFNGYCDDIPIIRPFLGIWKEEILAYCKENGLDYQTDKTNRDIRYTRNNLRHVIIPELEKVNPKFKQGVLRMRDLLNADNDALTRNIELLLGDVILESKKNFFKVEIEKFRNIPSGMQRRIIRFGLEAYFKIEADTSFLMVEAIRNVLLGKVNSGFSEISDRIYVSIEYAYGYVYSDVNSLDSGDELVLAGEYKNTGLVIPGIAPISKKWSIHCEIMPRIDMDDDFLTNRDMFIAFFDLEKVGKNLITRNWVEGNRYAPMGMNGRSMKLTDFWINKKVPKRLRPRWPLICAEERIIWIPGFQPGHDVIVSDDTKEILKISLVKKD